MHVRQQITKETWKRLKTKLAGQKKTHPNLLQKAKVHWAPCMNVDTSLSSEDILDVINSMNLDLKEILGDGNYAYELYPHFRSDREKSNWFMDERTKILASPLIKNYVNPIDDFRKNEAWKNAELRYDTIRNNEKYKAEFDNALEDDLKEFFRWPKHDAIEADPENLRLYFRMLAIDRLCWMPCLNDKSNDSTIHIYFAHRIETLKTLRMVNKYAYEMGGDRSLFLEIQFKLEPAPQEVIYLEAKNQNAKNDVEKQLISKTTAQFYTRGHGATALLFLFKSIDTLKTARIGSDQSIDQKNHEQSYLPPGTVLFAAQNITAKRHLEQEQHTLMSGQNPSIRATT